MATDQILADQPAVPPPEGMESNFDNPPSMETWILGVGITCMTIMTVSVSIRTYAKAVIFKEFMHEDFWITGLVSSDDIFGINRNYRERWNIRAIDLPHLLYMTHVYQVVYAPVVGASKYFVCIQLKRIFCPLGSRRNGVWWALQIILFMIVAYYISCFFTFLLQCIPREKIWNPATEGVCIDGLAAVFAAGFINLALDLGILGVPIWAIWHLNVPMKRKLGAISIFAVGIFTCAIAALGIYYRILYWKDVENQGRRLGELTLWAFAEQTGTMVIGCMPLFPRFYEYLRINRGHLPFFQSIKERAVPSIKDTNSLMHERSIERIVSPLEPTRTDAGVDNYIIELEDSSYRWQIYQKPNA